MGSVQGIAPNIARQLAIALNKSAVAKAAPRKGYHEAFAEAAKAILPKAMVNMLHVNARAIAGGHGKAAMREAAQDDQRGDVIYGALRKHARLGRAALSHNALVSKAEGAVPPKSVQSACRRGLDLAPEHGGPGLTEGAKARARSMASGNAVSADQIKRMAAYFSRHQSDKKDGWGDPPTPGYVAWMLWGGDAGRLWANAKAESVSKAEFDESAHPRSDNGEFSAGGAGSSEPKASERLKAERDNHFAAAREADSRGDYKAASAHRAAAVKANKDHIKAIRGESNERIKAIREEGRALREPRGRSKLPQNGREAPTPRASEPVGEQAQSEDKRTEFEHVDQKDGESHHQASQRHAQERLTHVERAERALKNGDKEGFKSAMAASKRSSVAFNKHRDAAENLRREEVRSLNSRLDALSGIASKQQREISRRNRALDRAPLAKALHLLTVVKANKPMGAAFAHARASGKKQDHGSRKRRANRWLKDNRHQTIKAASSNLFAEAMDDARAAVRRSFYLQIGADGVPARHANASRSRYGPHLSAV